MITGPYSYLETSDEFIAHWIACNTALGGSGPLLLTEGEAVADLQALRVTLIARWAEVEDARNDREFARADINLKKGALLERLNQFIVKVRAVDASGLWTGQLPKAFGFTDGMGKVLPALQDMAGLWAKYEAEGPSSEPLLLPGAYALATFTADVAALVAAYAAYSSADKSLGLARGRRNMTQDLIYPMLKRYRLCVPAAFPEGSAEMATLPRLTPPPGHTPDPVPLSAVFNATTTQADLSWEPTTDASAEDYEVWGNVGPEYDADDATKLETLAAGGATTFSTAFGMGLPGGAATFKVFVKTTEGNVRGSNPATVERPPT